METTKRNYKVDVGSTARFFETLELAKPFLDRYFQRHNIVLSVVKVERPKRTPKQAAFDFFYANAGFSYDPKTETPHKGRARCARELAKAERDAVALGYTFQWRDDWSVGDHFKEYGEAYNDGEPSTCETCICLDPDGQIVESLGCIDDATSDYRRVVEAELASEALAEVAK